MKDQTKYTLLTNINFASVIKEGFPMRLECRALLVDPGDKKQSLGGAAQLRGFSTEGSAPIFTYWLDDKSLPYTIESNVSDDSKAMLTDSGLKPIFSGSTLTFGCGLKLFLQASDQDRPLDVYEQAGDITRLRDILQVNVAKYWMAPNMPYQKWTSAENLRTLLAAR